jgi:hypothetical protein
MGIAHGPYALAAMPLYFDIYALSRAGIVPETSAYAVLSQGIDYQMSLALFNGLLDLFFQDPRADALSVLFSVYIAILLSHHLPACSLDYILDI